MHPYAQFSAVVLALALGAADALVRTQTRMAAPCGINGFGRIGRLVARIMVRGSLMCRRFLCVPDTRYFGHANV